MDEPQHPTPRDHHDAHAAGTPRQPRHAGHPVLRWALGLLGALVLVVVGALVWFWHTAAGTHALLARVPGLTVQGQHGRPTGGPFSMDKLVWQSGTLRVEVDGLSWRNAHWRLHPYAGAYLGLMLDQPQAQRVVVTTLPSAQPQPKAQAPASLKLPIELVAPHFAIGTLQVGSGAAITALSADLHFGADHGAQHRIEQLALTRDGVAVRGDVRIGTAQPLPVRGVIGAANGPQAAHAWRAGVRLGGALARIEADAQLQLAPSAHATLQAAIAPFAAWPLAALQGQWRGIDLADFAPSLPHTALAGEVRSLGPAPASDSTHPDAGSAPLRLALTNTEPGPWDAHRLPVAALQAVLHGRPGSGDALTLDPLVIELAGTRPAGRVQGQARWTAQQLRAQAQLQAVRPAQLMTSAPAMTLAGPLQLTLNGLALPGQPPAGGAQHGGLDGTLQARLQGELDRPHAPPVQLQADARFADQPDGRLTLALSRLDAHGAGEAHAAAQAERDAQGDWHLQSQGTLAGFDPAPWVPALAQRARGPSDLNARWTADLTLPAQQPAGLLAAVRGKAQVDMPPSRLSGLPLQGQAQLQATGETTTVQAELQAARNVVHLHGERGARTGPQWQADVQAPALAALAPLRDWLPAAAAAWFPDQGSLQARARADGSGARLRSEGELHAAQLHSAQWQMAQADARWQLAPHELQAPLALQLDAHGLALGTRRVQRVQARLQGTAASHQLQLDADASLRPPDWMIAAQQGRAADAAAARAASDAPAAATAPGAGPRAATSTTATSGTGAPLPHGPQTASSQAATAHLSVTPQGQLRATTSNVAPTAPPGRTARGTPGDNGGTAFHLALQGHWQPAADGGRWQGTLQSLRAQPQRGGAPWLATQDLPMQLQLANGLQPTAITLAPGRLVIFGGALRWREAAWQAGSGARGLPRVALDAQIEPLAVAPWLAALQPDYGWHGDLMLGGHVVLHTAQALDADVLVARQRGDLAMRFQGVPHALGLSALQVALTAQHGAWTASENVAGRQLGVLQGRQATHAGPGALLPANGQPLAGDLVLRVPDLAVWSPWLPAGWQAAGRLQGQLALGGHVGAPSVTGQVSGTQLAVDDLFEGVHLRNGELALALQGDHATLQRLVFRGDGSGALQATGGARFSPSPSAAVHVVADHFRALDRVDRRVTISGNADAGLKARQVALSGRFTVDSGLIDVSQSDAPQLGQDVVVVDRTMPAPNAPGGAANASGTGTQQPAGLGAVDLNLAVDLGHELRVRGHGIDTGLQGRLDITSPHGQLAVNGVIRAVDGTYKAYGQNLVVERGRLVFTGAVGNPRLDVLAVRQDLDQVQVGVQVTGYASDPRIQLYSAPQMSEMDTLTWLVLGRAPGGLGTDDSALLQRAALALLAGDKNSNSKSFAQRIGLDQLSVHQSDTSTPGSTASGTIVSLGKQISKRLFVGYEHALAAAGGTWDLIYRLAGRFSVQARSGDQNSIDAVWTWRWD